MLIRFTLENWRSFHRAVTFSAVAGRERHYRERLPVLERYQARVLPISVLYGGNASGKSNFLSALDFVQSYVVRGTLPDEAIGVQPFLLERGASEEPSSFKFELLADETVYEFSFSVTAERVWAEKLVRITETEEGVLYERRGDELVSLSKKLPDQAFLRFAFQGTRSNQLFLTNSVQQNVQAFRPVYDWFSEDLVLIAPDASTIRMGRFLDKGDPLNACMTRALTQLDTGILGLGKEKIAFENLPLPESARNQVKAKLGMVKEGSYWITDSLHRRFAITKAASGEFVAYKMVTFHRGSDDSETKFEISQESDGSLRVIDLLPAFLDISSPASRKVFVIDELDRSLHTLLTRELIESYLESCSAESRSQLIFTTHDVLLMDQDLFRRDEMWVAEREATGTSSLIALSDYKDIRFDKDIRRSYLQGRFGGIPRILLGGAFQGKCMNPGKGEAD